MNDNPLKGLRCLGMCRCSSDPQTEDSIEQQLLVLKKGCREREMIWVDHEEETTSGSDPGNRADLDRLLHRKKTANDYDVILVQDRSRWTRAGQGHGSWLRVEFGKLGVRVISTKSKGDGTSRWSWIDEGVEDEANLDYISKFSFNSCRGVKKKRDDGILAYTNTPPFGIDRLYQNAEGLPLHIIRNLPDGRQQRLDAHTKKVVETYPKEVKGKAKRHYRKQKTERVVLIPGADEAVEMVRFVMDQHYINGIGFLRISRLMDAKGWLNSVGRRWGKQAVAQIVHQTIYTGRGMSKVWASGKFNIHDEGAPREVPYDLGVMMGRRKVKHVRRPPDEWKIYEYPNLHCILGKEMADLVFEKQKEYLTQQALGTLGLPNRDRHQTSSFFLKQVLKCSETGKLFTGRNSGDGHHRYYIVSQFHETPNPDRPWERRGLPADPVENTTKLILQEVLGAADHFAPLIRTVVEQETEKRARSDRDLIAVNKECAQVDEQVLFAVSQLSDLGTEAVKKIVGPLKERRHTLVCRRSHLESSQTRKTTDVEKTVKAVVSDLSAISTSMDEMTPQLMRSLFMSFTDIRVNLKDWEIDVDVQLPSWAVERAGSIKNVVGLLTDQGSSTRQWTQPVEPTVLASYNCKLQPPLKRKTPCLTCSRLATRTAKAA